MNSLAFLTVHVHCKIMVIFNCSNLVDVLHSKVMISGVWVEKKYFGYYAWYMSIPFLSNGILVEWIILSMPFNFYFGLG